MKNRIYCCKFRYHGEYITVFLSGLPTKKAAKEVLFKGYNKDYVMKLKVELVYDPDANTT